MRTEKMTTVATSEGKIFALFLQGVQGIIAKTPYYLTIIPRARVGYDLVDG